MLDLLDKVSIFLAEALKWLAGCFLVGMMFLACANMVLRAVWIPVQGTFELMGFMGAVVAALSLAFAQRQRAHVCVGILLGKFPISIQRIANALTNAISCLLFIFCGLETVKWGFFLVQTGELSETLHMIYYPFVFAAALGCFALSFVLLVDILKILTADQV